MKIGFIIERKENPNQMGFRLEKPVVLNVYIKEEIEKTCRGIKNLLGVKTNMSGKKMVGITITNCAGWKNEELVKKVKSEIKKAIENKM